MFEGMNRSDWLTLSLAVIVVALMMFVVPRFAHPLPLCEHEDGSGQTACMWDATRQGNGRGLSYIIRNGHVVEYL